MKPLVDAVPTPKVIDPVFRARVVALDSAARAGRLTLGECNEENLTGIGRSMTSVMHAAKEALSGVA